jgi:hypothetical protein
LTQEEDSKLNIAKAIEKLPHSELRGYLFSKD